MKRVVIVEDTLWIAEQFERQFARENISVKTVRTAELAIDLIDDVTPDAIVLDMLLTGSTALPLLHELQSHSDLSGIPVIVVSAVADRLPKSDLKAYGVHAVIDKTTMLPDDVVTAVKRVLI